MAKHRRCQAKTWSQAQSGEKGKRCSRTATCVDDMGHQLCTNHYNKPTGFGWNEED